MYSEIIIYIVLWSLVSTAFGIGATIFAYRVRSAFTGSLFFIFFSFGIWLIGLQEFFFQGIHSAGYDYMILSLMYMSLGGVFLSSIRHTNTYTRMPLRVFLITLTIAHILVSITYGLIYSPWTIMILPLALIVFSGMAIATLIGREVVYVLKYTSGAERKVYLTPRMTTLFYIGIGVFYTFILHLDTVNLDFINFTVLCAVGFLIMTWSLLRLHVLEFDIVKKRMGVYIPLMISITTIFGFIIYVGLMYFGTLLFAWNLENYMHGFILLVILVLVFSVIEKHTRKLFYPFLNSGSTPISNIFQKYISFIQSTDHYADIQDEIIHYLKEVSQSTHVAMVTFEEDTCPLNHHFLMYPIYSPQDTEQKKFLIVGEKENNIPYSEKEKRGFVTAAYYLGIIEYMHTLNNQDDLHDHEKPNLQRMPLFEEDISDIAHRIQTPITIACLELEMLKKHVGDADWITSFEHTIRDISGFVYDILHKGAVHEEELDDDISIIEVHTLLQDLARSFSKMAPSYNAEIILESLSEIYIHGNYDEIKECLSNIIHNALKYGKENEKNSITISATRTSEILSITISDTGIGIPKDEQA